MAAGLVITAGATSSQAVEVTLQSGTAVCTANATKPSLAASASAYACPLVQVNIRYNRLGTNYTNYGEQDTYSYAKAGTSTIVSRAVRAKLGGSWSAWKTY
ncbi:hypothetical protein [Isoptericola dokdonensis]|nr:hypothetical protein [Isoptericola dokdonensis]